MNIFKTWWFWSIFIAVLAIVVIVLLIVFIPKLAPKAGPTISSDLEPAELISCPATINLKNLVACTPGDVQACKNCDGLSSCYNVTDNEPYTFYADDNTTARVPNGSWCIPTRVTTKTCNAYTATYVLSKVSATENEWNCLCKYPELV